MKITKIKIKTLSDKYPILIGSGVIKFLPNYLKENSINFTKCLVIIDHKVPKKLVFEVLKKIPKSNIITHYFHAKELNKNQKSVNKILDILLEKNFMRNDCLISIGGGITGDVSGFAASIYKRGLKFINIPTTLLAQVDSSIGGKTGVNTKDGKNLIGSFYQPNLVISDINFLKTLPKREIVCGYGEILKHSLIADKKFFNFLNKNILDILTLRSPFIDKAIFKSCLIKKKIVEKDEKEKNLRKILNFGHTFAHAYEATFGYSKKLNHGEAVILGINTASKFSLLCNLLKIKEYNKIKEHLKIARLPNDIRKYFSIKNLKKIINFMTKDKKNYTNNVNLILLKKIGSPIFNKEFNKKKINSFLKKELIN
jgi:3-dehydroquinate synthase